MDTKQIIAEALAEWVPHGDHMLAAHDVLAALTEHAEERMTWCRIHRQQANGLLRRCGAQYGKFDSEDRQVQCPDLIEVLVIPKGDTE